MPCRRTFWECGAAEWNLVLVDSNGVPVICCRCLESSPSSMRLEAPTGGPVVTGGEYRLCAKVIDAHPRMIGCAHVTVSERRVVKRGERDLCELQVSRKLPELHQKQRDQ